MNVIGIDPGKYVSGYAIFRDGELERCGWAPPGDILEDVISVFSEASAHLLVVTEKMHIHKRSPVRTVDLADLLLQAGYIAGTVAARYPHAVWVKPEPKEWKGTAPKKIHHQRIEKKLDPGELAAVSEVLNYIPAGEHHNVWDAIGLGLWGLKR